MFQYDELLGAFWAVSETFKTAQTGWLIVMAVELTFISCIFNHPVAAGIVKRDVEARETPDGTSKVPEVLSMSNQYCVVEVGVETCSPCNLRLGYLGWRRGSILPQPSGLTTGYGRPLRQRRSYSWSVEATPAKWHGMPNCFGWRRMR